MAEPEAERRASTSGDEADEGRLAQFGYKQELKRDWGLAHNFGISFSIIVGVHGPQTACCSAMALFNIDFLVLECYHGHHDSVRLWLEHRWTCRYVVPECNPCDRAPDRFLY
jgi:hypothetical protein